MYPCHLKITGKRNNTYSGSEWLPDSAHALTSTGYFCKDDFFKISFEKDFRSTQGKGGNNNAQVEYVILFPYVIQSMW